MPIATTVCYRLRNITDILKIYHKTTGTYDGRDYIDLTNVPTTFTNGFDPTTFSVHFGTCANLPTCPPYFRSINSLSDMILIDSNQSF